MMQDAVLPIVTTRVLVLEKTTSIPTSAASTAIVVVGLLAYQHYTDRHFYHNCFDHRRSLHHMTHQSNSTDKHCIHADDTLSTLQKLCRRTFLSVVDTRVPTHVHRVVIGFIGFSRSVCDAIIRVGLGGSGGVWLGSNRLDYVKYGYNAFFGFRNVLKTPSNLYNRLRRLFRPWLSRLPSWLSLLLPWCRSPPLYTTYPTPEAEQQYWDSARVFRRRLQSWDARFCGDYPDSSSCRFNNIDEYEESFPVVSSYQPALPPLHALQTSRSRDARTNTRYCGSPAKNQGREEKVDYHLPTKTFRKWYRMTFPDKPPLTPLEASRLKRSYNPDEKREMDRISRLVTNRRAFHDDRRDAKDGKSFHRLDRDVYKARKLNSPTRRRFTPFTKPETRARAETK
ncbi:hypothetical protein C8J55DRAFT_162216 [Lentinula edodes]|uniref:Uncharacterized protein n=1 Tax=Lentinula lateritia TaxID=40482 RepID=A0A9W9E005_9AGAR|nr:hypothetical protein C8J55DRAFT_162216 [Lentinula edodes]